jgi:hypothetical protein
VNGDISFNLQKRRRVDQFLCLGVDGIGRVAIGNGRNRALVLLLFVGLLLCVVELDLALQHGAVGAVVWRALLVLFLRLLVLLLAWRFDDTVAPFPGNARTESDAHPFLNRQSRPFHDDVDVVQGLALGGDQGTRVSLLEGRVLEHGKSYPRGPLDE